MEMLDKKQTQIFLYMFKTCCKAADTTHSVSMESGRGSTMKVHYSTGGTRQWTRATATGERKCLEDEEHCGQPSQNDSDLLNN